MCVCVCLSACLSVGRACAHTHNTHYYSSRVDQEVLYRTGPGANSASYDDNNNDVYPNTDVQSPEVVGLVEEVSAVVYT